LIRIGAQEQVFIPAKFTSHFQLSNRALQLLVTKSHKIQKTKDLGNELCRIKESETRATYANNTGSSGGGVVVAAAVAITCLWHVWSVGGASFFAAQPG